ncbi:hypothetical protein EV137_1745 [Kribbella pratensis]|uniref:Uncharacterized protein n=1 Tax=Kribbella pratensis TaxID=2512112 RepID=A0ABY2FMU5_9ACTN|nr:hypothetical protein EV137_1745 [Kribbella pratensis]
MTQATTQNQTHDRPRPEASKMDPTQPTASPAQPKLLPTPKSPPRDLWNKGGEAQESIEAKAHELLAFTERCIEDAITYV